MSYLKKQLDDVKKLNDLMMPISLAIVKLEEHEISLEELDIDIESIKDDLDSIYSALHIALVTIIENPAKEELENSTKITAQSEIKKLNDEAMVRDWEEQADREIDKWIDGPFKKREE